MALQPFHVAGLEAGTARVLKRLVETGNGAERKEHLGDEIREICAALLDGVWSIVDPVLLDLGSVPFDEQAGAWHTEGMAPSQIDLIFLGFLFDRKQVQSENDQLFLPGLDSPYCRTQW